MKKSNNYTTFYKNVKKVLFLTLLLIGFVSFAQVGIGTTDPDYSLHVKGDGVKIENTAGDNHYILPVVDGTAGQVLTTDGSNTVTWGNEGHFNFGTGGELAATNATGVADYSLNADNNFFLITTAAGFGNCVFTLPIASAANLGRIVYIFNVTGGNNIITVTYNGSTENILTGSGRGFFCNGSSWYPL